MRFRSRQFNGGDGIQVCLNQARMHIRSEFGAERQLMTYAHVCSRMLSYADVCSSELTCAGVGECGTRGC
jgi:hypothetical protein